MYSSPAYCSFKYVSGDVDSPVDKMKNYVLLVGYIIFMLKAPNHDGVKHRKEVPAHI